MESFFEQLLKHTNAKIFCRFILVQIFVSVLAQVRCQRFCCFWKVVVWNLGAEKMMYYMSVRYMVMQLVDPKPITTINGFESCFDETPIIVVIDQRRVPVMLKISNSEDP